jgi:putative transposase
MLYTAGKPMQNGFVERFNRTYRTETLDSYIFSSLKEARLLTGEWLYHYNENRPHESLQNMTPKKYHQMHLLKKENSAKQKTTLELSTFQQIV